jgi:quinol monooxygenase YgiN
MSGLALTVRFRARPGAELAALGALSRLAAASRQERGCLEFRLHQAPEDGSVALLYERWAGQDALAAHEASPHLRAFQAEAPRLVEWPPDVCVWRPHLPGATHGA